MTRRLAGLAAIVAALLGLGAFGALPAVSDNGTVHITEPAHQPVALHYDANGQPVPFTIKVAGFAPFTQVYIMQCDGVPWNNDNWKPTLDCDVGSAPAPAIAGQDGVAVFAANDPNHVMKVFRGKSPEEQFNCLAPDDPSPKNDLRDFRNCSLRVSTSNLEATPDQVQLALAYPAINAASKSGSSDSNALVWLVVLLIAIVVVVAVVVLARRARSRASTAS